VRAERYHLGSATAREAADLAQALRALASAPPELAAEVRELLAAVYERGDAAVLELTRRFDSPAASEELRVPPERLEAALNDLDRGVRQGLELAVENVGRVCRSESADDASIELPQGQRVELRALPVQRAGVYVPGGRAAYPSSAVMCCVPARTAGVEQIAVATPPGPDGEASSLVLAACALCEVDEVYRMGGAQAVGALAFGTESVERVDVIVGPGSYYVQEAKRQVTGVVGIDGVAGPSELVVVADAHADPRIVALDLAAQSEHGAESLLVLLATTSVLLDQVEVEIDLLEQDHGTISDAPVALVSAPSLEAAVAVANAIAPEHLELACHGAEALAAEVRASGCVFIGAGGGAAFGDYVAGSNHVLPTGGAARFDGPLGVARFQRRQALVWLPERAARSLAPFASRVARAEGFPVHARSTEARVNLSAREGRG
jgi:histidinol dehydrogenase